jgi:hypothetical protein
LIIFSIGWFIGAAGRFRQRQPEKAIVQLTLITAIVACAKVNSQIVLASLEKFREEMSGNI